MPPSSNPDETRLRVFVEHVRAELYKIPTPQETQAFLAGNEKVRREIVRACKLRARPLLDMLREVDYHYLNV